MGPHQQKFSFLSYSSQVKKNLHPLLIPAESFQREYFAEGIYCSTLAEHNRRYGPVNKPHRHQFYTCVLFTRGQGYHEVDFERTPVGKGYVFFVKPGQMHHWSLSERSQGVVIMHTDDFFQRHLRRSAGDFPFYYSVNNPPFFYLSTLELDEIRPVFEEVASEFQESHPYKEAFLAASLQRLYILLSRIYCYYTPEVTVTPGEDQLLRDFENLMTGEGVVKRSLHYFASRLATKPGTLDKLARKVLQRGAPEWITEMQVLAIKRLLAGTDITPEEISRMAGFGSYSEFSLFFRRQSGYSPLTFSRNYRKPGHKQEKDATLH